MWTLMSDWQTSLFTGIFTRFSKLTPRPHDPDCALASGITIAGDGDGATASGIGWDDAMAQGACVGEAIERMHGAPACDDRLVSATFANWPLADAAIDPLRWVLFHAEQTAVDGFPFRPFTHDTLCEWVCCRDAQTGEPGWAPAEMVYLHMPNGHRIAPCYSTGLAAGRFGDAVLLRGLQEVIERDAIMGAWWGRYAIEEHAETDVLAHLGDDIRARIVRPNLRYRWLSIATPFSAHATMVTLEGKDREGYCFSIGSSCRETRGAGWQKSLLEAIHGRHFVRHLKTQSTVGHCPASFADHAVYYSMHPERLRDTVLMQPCIKPASERCGLAGYEPLDTLLAKLGPDRPVLFRSMTPSALASEQLGWQVLRVLVPGLQPLHGHHAYPHLGGPLWQPRGLRDWHALPPHPFP
jgi:ribosomal protein S12 methylthiotransferase accessory factor